MSETAPYTPEERLRRFAAAYRKLGRPAHPDVPYAVHTGECADELRISDLIAVTDEIARLRSELEQVNLRLAEAHALNQLLHPIRFHDCVRLYERNVALIAERDLERTRARAAGATIRKLQDRVRRQRLALRKRREEER